MKAVHRRGTKPPHMKERVYVFDHGDGKDVWIYWHTSQDPHEGWLLKTVMFPPTGMSVTEFSFVEMRGDNPYALRQGNPRIGDGRVYVDPEPPYDRLDEFDVHILEKMIPRAFEVMAGGAQERRRSRSTSREAVLSNPTTRNKQFSRRRS